MFKIGEFSKLTQVSVRMLRHYDQVNLLKPAKIDSQTGYRMYSIDQIPILNKIIYLRDSGFNITEIANALNNDDLIVQYLDEKYSDIMLNIQTEQNRLRKIEIAKKELIHKNNDMHYHVSIKSVPSYHVLSLRKIIPNYYAEGELWMQLSHFANQQNIEVSQETFSIYHDDDYKDENVDVELCVITKTKGQNQGHYTFRHTESIKMMACTMVYGDFSNIAGAYIAFANWLQENSQYNMGNTSRQIVHRGPWNEENPDKYLIEIQIPLEANYEDSLL